MTGYLSFVAISIDYFSGVFDKIWSLKFFSLGFLGDVFAFLILYGLNEFDIDSLGLFGVASLSTTGSTISL